jgi:hypothetical protein
MPLTKIQSLGITDGTIVNADINASAAIAGTKLSGAGKVLQIVNASTQTQTSSTSGTYADTTLTASITPSSASNKVLILINQNVGKGNADNYLALQLLRGATAIGGSGDIAGNVGYTSSSNYNYIGTGFSCSFLDSPNTTSSTTYKTQFNRQGSGSTNVTVQQDSGASYITLIEIAG